MMKSGSLRKGLLASLHMASHDLGQSDADYRDMVRTQTGHDSAGDCTIPQLKRLIAYCKTELGWQPRPRCGKPVPRTADLQPLLDKIEALLADGKLPWAYADGILDRMYGITVSQAERHQLAACVAALTRKAA